MELIKLVNTNFNESYENLITETLILIGIPANLSGFKYLAEAIAIVVNDPNASHGITKVVYSQIADKDNVSPESVERTMRYAIAAAFDKDSNSIGKKIFAPFLTKLKTRPTNSEFICHLADIILYEIANI